MLFINMFAGGMKILLKLISEKSTVFKSALTLFLVFIILPGVLAQDSIQRPRIGLVLSGGGAHGIAHLGVLKVMEEVGLRPDLITGTSMGSIIGGFYSMGYSVDSMVNLLKTMDWDLILSNKIPENKIIFPEKDFFHNYTMSLPVFYSKIKLPSGLISGQQLENTLSYYAWPAGRYKRLLKTADPVHLCEC